MQIRRSSFPSTDSKPSCAFKHEHKNQPCLHCHGGYERYAGPHGDKKVRVVRYLCKFTGKTISVLPDHLLPYRAVHVPCLEEDFDQHVADQANADQANAKPEHCELVKGCLRRAWRRFADQSRHQSLTEFFGQRIALTNTAEELWQAIRLTAGKLKDILLELAVDGKSLLGDYRCLRP